MSDFTKRENRRLRELAAEAYDKEMDAALSALQERFQDWQQGVIGPHDLNQEIHEFHDGISRELYKTYTMGDSFYAVARAIRLEFLDRSKIEPAMLDKFESIFKFFQRDDEK